MRFLHAADIHLDSPLRGLEVYEGAPVEALRGATRKAFTGLVELALAEKVDFVIIAGDLYDGDWPDYNTGLFFVNRVRELDRAGIPVVLLTGNHDAASLITGQLTLPQNVHVLPTAEPGTILLDARRVALHGQGFAHQAETRNLAASYPAPVAGYFNIGVLHTALEGREGHDSYAPCSIKQLAAHGYDYWALGHIHKRESVHGSEHPRIEFPGNIQGRHVQEAGAKGCLLVTVDPEGKVVPEFRPLDVFRWEIVPVNATAAESSADVIAIAQETLREALDQAAGRPLAARIVITCSEPISLRLAADHEQVRADLRGLFGGDVWIEKVKFAAEGIPHADEPQLSDDALSEFRAVIQELRNHPEDFQEALQSDDCGKLIRLLPHELRTAVKQSCADLLDRASALLHGKSTESAS